MMIVPVDADINEAQHVSQENGHERLDHRPICSVRDLQLQHHDRDDDREHAVAEGFEAIAFHGVSQTLQKETKGTKTRGCVNLFSLLGVCYPF